jgi:hypothetical protein
MWADARFPINGQWAWLKGWYHPTIARSDARGHVRPATARVTGREFPAARSTPL